MSSVQCLYQLTVGEQAQKPWAQIKGWEPLGKPSALTSRSTEMDAGWTRTCQKAPEAWVHSPACQSLVLPCLGSSPPRRACSGHCQMRACVVGAESPALPALPAWSPACPATCSSAAPVAFPPAHCPPAASTSTSTPTHPAGHPAPFQPLAMASQRRNVSLGIWGCRSPRAGGGHLVLMCGWAL